MSPTSRPSVKIVASPAVAVLARGLHHKAVCIQQLHQPGTGALRKGNLVGAPADVVVWLWSVLALQAQVHAIEPHGVAIDHAGVAIPPHMLMFTRRPSFALRLARMTTAPSRGRGLVGCHPAQAARGDYYGDSRNWRDDVSPRIRRRAAPARAVFGSKR
jgi:hypothetical protein